MRRTEIQESANALLTALAKTEISKVLMEYGELARVEKSSSRIDSVRLASCFKEYWRLASGFNATTKKISEIFQLSDLESPQILAALMALKEGDRHIIIETAYPMLSNLNFAEKHIPKLLKLIEPDEIPLSEDGRKAIQKDQGLLTVIILQEPGKLSSSKRVEQVLESVSLLYEACGIFIKAPSSTLALAACDSGSDMSFDFFGLAKVIECVKDVILSLWDRIVFFREKQLSQRISLVAEALPIVERINELEKEKQIEPEQAEILRRKIIGGVSGFINAGAIIPEFEGKTLFNPRVIMTPEPKLLSAKPEGYSKTGESKKGGIEMSGSFRFENLSPLDQKALRCLLEKAKETKDNPDKQEDGPRESD